MRTRITMLVLFTFLLSAAVYSQSDYEKTQNFKKQYKQLEDAIKNAESFAECDSIGNEIIKFKSDYENDKALLDKSLYPDNFTTSFEKIHKALELRKGDFSQIEDLVTQVGTLKTQVTELSEKNQDLIGKIKELNMKSDKDAATIASLEKLVSQLKSNIQRRDMLVRDIVDSLLTEFVKSPSTMNDIEKRALISKVDSRDLFYNIERTISDNVQFMRVTQMNPEDLSDMKKQYSDFNKMWKQIGPKLASIYMDKKDRASEIANIDGMFFDWNNRIEDEMWGQVNKIFRAKQLSLLPFKTGNQFVNSVNSFADDEIKNYGVKSKDESEKTYHNFADSAYFKIVEPQWVPILIENNMMSEANKDSIESKITKWKSTVAPPSSFNWLYFVLGFVIIVLMGALIVKSQWKKIDTSPK